MGAAYDSDLQTGDVTTDSLELGDKLGEAKIVAKQNGIFCGALEAKWLIERYAPGLNFEMLATEGEAFAKEDILIKLTGKVALILSVERVLLNLVQRFCGIATQTERCVKRAAPVNVAATRKTLYGLLDKRAVAMGGGLTHRLFLGDAAIYKDTHFALMNQDWRSIAASLKRLPDDLPFVTIEVRQLDDLNELVKQLPSSPPWPMILLLDNFPMDQLASALSTLKKPEGLLIEASGGITEGNLADYAKTGVDVVSLGALTHTVTPIDLSLSF